MKKFLLGALAALLLLGIVAAAKGDFALGRSAEILFNIFREVNLLYVDDVDPDELVSAAAEGMAARLDPYTEYLPEEAMDDFEVATTGKYGGVGALIRQSDDYVIIAQVYRGFPADEAGLKVGDKIVEIDGKDARGMTTTAVSAALRGDAGSVVKLAVEQFYTGERRETTIRRRRIAISGVPYHGRIAEGIGYIAHSDFTQGCADDLRRALEDLQKDRPLKGLVIDLRGNGGGILQEAVKIVSLFVPKGTEVVAMRGKVAEMDGVFYTESEPVAPDLPLAILVNSGSASASEIVAGALQDLDRAVLVGQRTFGKGLVQSTRPVGYNAYLKITTAKYYIPSGRCIQAIDYAQRNEDGSVSHVPDSLVKPFKTAAGRVVYDGGGIVPEIVLEPHYLGRLVVEVYNRGYIEQFVDEYLRPRPALDIPPMFALSDEAWGLFVEFMREKPLDFRFETLERLRALRQTAERERTLADIADEIDQIERALPDDVAENLALHREDLQRLITDEIVLRRHYAQGVIAHDLPSDEEVVRAVELLGTPAEYARLLTPAAP